jgi:hypothetical protein
VKWLNLVDAVNVLARLEALAGELLYSRPQGLHGKPAPGAPTGMRELRLTRTGTISGADAVQHLTAHGIRCWAPRTSSDWFHWYVKAAQAP